MITTDDEEIYKKLKPMTWCGIGETTWDRVGKRGYSWDYEITTLGYKKYMNDITATLVLSKMGKIRLMNARRREIAFMYDNGLNIDYIDFPCPSETVQYYTLKVDNRDKIANYLSAKGISTSVHFKPLSEHPFFKKCIKQPLPITDRVWKRLLTLPVYDGLTDKQVRYIIRSFNEAVNLLREE
jgi:perosamine synthetase